MAPRRLAIADSCPMSAKINTRQFVFCVLFTHFSTGYDVSHSLHNFYGSVRTRRCRLFRKVWTLVLLRSRFCVSVFNVRNPTVRYSIVRGYFLGVIKRFNWTFSFLNDGVCVAIYWMTLPYWDERIVLASFCCCKLRTLWALTEEKEVGEAITVKHAPLKLGHLK